MPAQILGCISWFARRANDGAASRAARKLILALALSLFTGLMATPGQATDLPVEGGPGGGYFRSDCVGTGGYVAGVYLRTGLWVDAIGLKCASFNAAQGKFDRPAWNMPYHGGNGGGPQEGLCPDNSYVSAIMFNLNSLKTLFLDFVELTCTPIAGGSETKVCLKTDSGCYPSVGYFMEGKTVYSPVQACPPGEAAVGIHGRSGAYVDALGLVCGPRPVVAVAAPKPIKKLGKAKPIKKLGKAKPTTTATVVSDVDVYDLPGGVGTVIGMLQQGSTVPLLAACQDGWCNIQAGVPGGKGWVWGEFLTF
jgi:hypothetical protein